MEIWLAFAEKNCLGVIYEGEHLIRDFFFVFSIVNIYLIDVVLRLNLKVGWPFAEIFHVNIYPKLLCVIREHGRPILIGQSFNFLESEELFKGL